MSVQNLEAGNFSGGWQAGLTTSQMDGDKNAGYHKFGITAGFFVNRQFNTKLQGQFELRYNQKGAAVRKGEDQYVIRLNYMELPFTANFLIQKNLKLEAGLIPSVLINASRLDNSFKENIRFDTFDLPAAIGMYYILSKTVSFQLRESYSLFRVSGIFNNALTFALFYTIE